MTRAGLWLDRLREAWRSRSAMAARRALGLLARAFFRLLGAVAWELRLLSARLSGRLRVLIALIALVLLARGTDGSVPSLSEAAQALAVLCSQPRASG